MNGNATEITVLDRRPPTTTDGIAAEITTVDHHPPTTTDGNAAEITTIDHRPSTTTTARVVIDHIRPTVLDRRRRSVTAGSAVYLDRASSLSSQVYID